MQIGKVGPGLTYLSAFVFPEVPLTLCKQCCQARRKSISSRARACRDPALSGFGFDYLNPMCVCLAEFSLSCAMYLGVPQADVMRDRLTAPALAVINILLLLHFTIKYS